MGRKQRERKVRRAASIAGVLAVQSAPSVKIDTPYETSLQRFLREEREEAEAKIAPLVAANVIALRQLRNETNDSLRRYWSQPRFAQPWTAEAGTKVLSEREFNEDNLLEVPAGKPSQEAVQSAGEAWFDSLGPRLGVSLSPEGFFRCMNFVIAQYCYGKDFSTVAAYDAAFNRLNEVGAFAPSEYTTDSNLVTVRPQAEPVAEPEADIADIEDLDLESRDGSKRAKQIVEELATNEAVPLIQEWIKFLQTTYNFTPSCEDLKQGNAWFQRNQKNYFSHEAYNEVRRWMVSTRRWSETLLSPDELLAREIEATPLSTASYDQRRDLIRRVRPEPTE
jgi:hypothetical protein